jgi:hypothetical protein
VFADSSPFDFASAASNEFAARATGGVRLITALDEAGQPLAGVRLSPGSGSWSTLSAREAKENLMPVNGVTILERLASMPLSTWNYVGQESSVRHMGPMAQEFRSAFGLGEDDQHIDTVDADGVALAALQGVRILLEEKDAQIVSQQRQIVALEARVAALEAMAGGIEPGPEGQPKFSLIPWLLGFGLLIVIGGFLRPLGRR